MFKAIAKHRQAAVHEGNWCDAQAVEIKGLQGSDAAGRECGNERLVDVAIGIKDVLIHAAEKGQGVVIGVDIDGSLLQGIEAADFIQAEGVINVIVGEEDGIDALDAKAQALLAQVGTSINQDRSRISGWICEVNRGRGAKALITRIRR